MPTNDSQTSKNLLDLIQIELADRSKKTPTLIRPVHPWAEWIESPYYSGDFCKKLYPYWKHEVKYVIDNNINEWIITGGIGVGKTWAANAYTAYRIYVLSRYDYPQRLFNLADSSTIYIAYLTTTQKQAKLSGFKELREMIDGTKYFQDEFQRNKRTDMALEWGSHRIHVLPGSSSQDVLSLNLLGVELDELNFHRKGGSGKIGDIEKAQNDYNQTTSRRRSRFLNNGVDHGFSILISSATIDTSFTNKRIKDGRVNKQENQHVTCVRAWEAKAGVEIYSDRKFAVFCGNNDVDPILIDEPIEFLDLSINNNELTEIIDKEISKDDVTLQSVVDVLPSELRERVVLVPWDFHMEFVTDLISAIQNRAGLSTGDEGKFFSSRILWLRSCLSELHHPFIKEAVPVTIFTSPILEDFFLPHKLFNMKTNEFLRHPHERRYVHIDQSTSIDSTGVGMVHLAGMHEGDFGMIRPMVELDFAMRIVNTKKPDNISLSKILKFFFWLSDTFQVQYGRISYDQYGSHLQIQELLVNNIPSGRTSLDTNDIPWVMFRQLLDSGRFQQYETEFFKEEFFNLVHDRRSHKVDHTSTSTKDISDGVVGAVFDCLNDVNKNSAVTPEQIRDNLLTLGASQRGSGQSVISGRSDWILAGYEKTMKGKVTALGNAKVLRMREKEENE